MLPVFRPLLPVLAATLALTGAGLTLPVRAQVPAVTGRAPARNAVSAPRPANVALTFSQPMNAGTASNAAVRVFSNQRGGLLTRAGGGGVFSGGGTSTIAFDPATDFRPGEVIRVTATPAAQSTGGQALAPGQVHQFTAAAGAATGTFSPGADLPMGTGAQASTTADIDGDGDLDLLTCDNAAAGLVSIRRNDGTGTFGPAATTSVRPLPTDLAVADLDGDGDLDLLTLAQLAGVVSIRFNDGTGTFSGTTEVPVGPNPRALAVGDMDADGDLDLATANLGDATVSIRYNDGAGTFTGLVTVAVSGGPYAVTLADVDADGDLDLLTASGTNTVSIRRNVGLGAFTAVGGAGTAEVAVAPGCFTLTVADVDNDGDLDLLAGCHGPRTVAVCANDGTGAFGLPTAVPVAGKPTTIAMGDVDGDGDLDLLAANFTSPGTVSIRRNAGGAFSGSTEVPINDSPLHVGVADFNGDGTLDFYTTSAVSGTVSVRLNASPPAPFALVSTTPAANAANVGAGFRREAAFNQPLAIASAGALHFFSAQAHGDCPHSTLVPGINGPHTADLYTTNDFRPGELIDWSISAAARSSSTGQFLDRPHVRQFRVAAGVGPGTLVRTTTVPVSGTPSDVVLADVNADGFLDVLTLSYGGAVVNVRLGTGAGTFAATGASLAVGANPLALLTADLDNDGDLDVLTANSGSNTVNVRRNDGAGTFSALPTVVAGAGPIALATADVDGDGDLDLLIVNQASNTVRVRLNSNVGTFSGGTDVPVGVSPTGLALGDIDGDDDLDLLTVSNIGSVSIRRNDGTGAFGNPAEVPVGANPTGLALGDIDGDGDLDFLTADMGDNTVSLRRNDGTGTFGGTASFAAPHPLDLKLADVDGDGDLDALVASNDEHVRVHRNTGGTFGDGTGPLIGYNLRTLAVGDVDGDGDLDAVAVSQVDGGTVTVLLNQIPTPFALVSTAPAPNTVSAAPAGPLTFTFNQAYDPIALSALRVFDSQTGNFLTPTHLAIGSVVTVNPGGAYRPGEVISTTVTAGARSATTGQTLARGHVQQFRVAAGAGPGTFVPGRMLPTSASPGGVAAADVDGDGDLDLLNTNIGAGTGTSTVQVTRNLGSGNYAAPVTVPVGDGPLVVVAADVDGDFDLDLLTAGDNVASICLNNGSGSGTFGPAQVVPVGNFAAALVVGDIDADGDLDLLVSSYTTNRVTVCRNDGAGTFSSAPSVAVGANPMGLALGDVDHDGDLDLVTANFGALGTSVSLRRNDGDGTFGGTTELAGGNHPEAVALADVDGDGDLDLLATHSYEATIQLLRNDGTGAFGPVTVIPTGANPRKLALADVDGDGDLDLLATTGTFVTQFRNDGTGAFAFNPLQGAIDVGATISVADLALADLDGDGDLDLLTANAGADQTIGLCLNAPLSDLVVSTMQSVPAGLYRNITVTGTGFATLAGDVAVTGRLLIQANGRLRTLCHVVVGPGDFVLAARGQLYICSPDGISATGPTGDIQVTGGRTFSPDALYSYDGTAPQITGSGLPTRVLELDQFSPFALTLSRPLALRAGATLAGTGNLLLGGQPLTLLSTADTTAMVVNLGAGAVVGTATVQRYLTRTLNAGLGYRHLSSPVVSTTVADLAAPGFVPLLNPAFNALPYVAPPAASFPNVLGYDEARGGAALTDFLAGYFSPAALASPLVPGRGYAVLMRATVVPDFVGTLTTGPVPLTLTRTGSGIGDFTKAGWHLLGNPYPSPLLWDAIPAAAFPANMSQSVSVFRSTGLNAGVFLARVNGMGTLPNGEIPMAQGLFVRVVAGTSAAFSFENAYRPIGYCNPAHYRTAPDPRPLLGLTLRAAGAPADHTAETLLYFQAGATPGPDNAFDGPLPGHNTGAVPTLVSLTSTGEEMAVNGLPETALTTNQRIPLLVDVPAAGIYELNLSQLSNLDPGTVSLYDTLTATTQPLTMAAPYTWSARRAGVVRNRFWLLLGARPLGTTPLAATPLHLLVAPNPATETVRLSGAVAGPVLLLDALGRVVLTVAADATGAATLNVRALPAGVYLVRNAGHTARVVVE